MQQVKAPKAWQRGLTAKNVKVAVLDIGADIDHPDLKGRIKATKDFTSEDNDVTDEHGHGTHVVAGSGPEPGTAPDADLLIGKVCGPSGCEESAVIAGMRWAAEQGAKVVNLSLGGDATDGTDELSQELNSLSAKYTLASGTSMATPYVTGAAAILAGQHPDWSPARLKAALTGSADPIGAKVFEQGTAVVNLDRAT